MGEVLQGDVQGLGLVDILERHRYGSIHGGAGDGHVDRQSIRRRKTDVHGWRSKRGVYFDAQKRCCRYDIRFISLPDITISPARPHSTMTMEMKTPYPPSPWSPSSHLPLPPHCP